MFHLTLLEASVFTVMVIDIKKSNDKIRSDDFVVFYLENNYNCLYSLLHVHRQLA
jgi:hypothetical protein